ncbi:MAG: four helix bundle protein [Verrucomicrobiales bacterium]
MPSDTKQFDLEERTFQFALKVRQIVAKHDWSREHWKDLDQIIRSSGSIGANYIEANDGLSKQDFIYRIKIAKKEAKETRYWARLLGAANQEPVTSEFRAIYREADELMRILATVLKNYQRNS